MKCRFNDEFFFSIVVFLLFFFIVYGVYKKKRHPLWYVHEGCRRGCWHDANFFGVVASRRCDHGDVLWDVLCDKIRLGVTKRKRN